MLPLMNTPTFKTVIPSVDQEILMRPFLVKEEKILLLAKQSKDKDQIFLSVMQVVQNCMVDQEFDVSKLPFFDVEYLFIQLRLNSIGDNVSIKLYDDEVDGEVDAEIDLNDLNVVANEVEESIKLDDDTVINFKYPTLKDLSKIDAEDDVSSFFDLLKYCIDSVVQGDAAYTFNQYTDEEKDQFIESLNMEQMNLCKQFISNLPSVQIEAKWKIGKEQKSKTIKGMNSFF